jgi:hypothetical protein
MSQYPDEDRAVHDEMEAEGIEYARHENRKLYENVVQLIYSMKCPYPDEPENQKYKDWMSAWNYISVVVKDALDQIEC